MRFLTLSALLILSIAFFTAEAIYFRSQVPKVQNNFKTKPQSLKNNFELYLSQPIDHFNKQDTRIFRHRYLINNQFYKLGSPVFLFICGQGDCTLDSDQNFALEEVKKFNGLFLALEHRYYGFSQPFNDFKTENLAYLTVEQALEDIAYFINWYKNSGAIPVLETSPWVTIGLGYGGTLAAWFRAKYPDFTSGTWASSPPLNASLEIPNYDANVHYVLNTTEDACSYLLQQVFDYFEYQLYNTTIVGQKAFQALFGKYALNLSQEEMLYFFAEKISLQEEMGAGSSECFFLVVDGHDFKTVLGRTILSISGNDPRPYSSYYLRNSTIDWGDLATLTLGRQQAYQTCTQLGWLKLPSKDPNYGIRSQRLTLDFYQRLCKESFGIEFKPTPDSLNKEFGGLNLNATNLIIVNGIEDPWRDTSLLESKGDIESILINCEGCSQGREIGYVYPEEHSQVQKAREQIHNFLVKILFQ